MAPKFGLGKSTSKQMQTTLSGTGSGLQPGTSASDVNHKVLIEADAQAADRIEESGLAKLRYALKYIDDAAQLDLDKRDSVLAAHNRALPIQRNLALHAEVQRAEQEDATFETIYNDLQAHLVTGFERLTSDIESHKLDSGVSDMIARMREESAGLREESAQLKERIARQRKFSKGLDTSIADKQERAEQFRKLEDEAVSKLKTAFEARVKPLEELAAEKESLEKEIAGEAAQLKLARDSRQQAQHELETLQGKRIAAQAETDRLDALSRSANEEHRRLTAGIANMHTAQHTSDQIGSVVAANNAYAGQVAGLEAKGRELERQLGEAKVLVEQIPGLQRDIAMSEAAKVGIQADLDSEKHLRKSKEDLLPVYSAIQTEVSKKDQRIIELTAQLETSRSTVTKRDGTIAKQCLDMEALKGEANSNSAVSSINDQLRRELEALQKAHDELKSSNSVLHVEHERLKASHENCESTRAGLTTSNGTLQKDKDDLREAKEQLGELLRQSQDAHSGCADEKSALSRKADDLQLDVQAKQTALDDLQERNAGLETDIAELRRTALAKETNSNSQVNELMDKSRQATEKSRHSEKLRQEINVELTKSKRTVDEYTRKINDLQKELGELQTKFNDINLDCSNAKTTGVRLTGQLAQSRQTELDLGRTLNERTGDLNHERSVNEQHTEQLTRLEFQLETIRADLRSRDSELKDTKSKLANAEFEVAQAAGTLASLEELAEQHRTRHSEQCDQIRSQHKRELDSARGREEALRLEINALKRDIRELNSTIALADSEMASKLFEHSIAAREEAQRNAQAKVDAAVKTFDNATKSFEREAAEHRLFVEAIRKATGVTDPARCAETVSKFRTECAQHKQEAEQARTSAKKHKEERKAAIAGAVETRQVFERSVNAILTSVLGPTHTVPLTVESCQALFSNLINQREQAKRDLDLLKQQIGLAADVSLDVVTPQYSHDLIKKSLEFQRDITKAMGFEDDGDLASCLENARELQSWSWALYEKIIAIRPYEEGEEEKFTYVAYITYVVDVLVHHLSEYQEELALDTRLRQEAREAAEKADAEAMSEWQ